VPSSVGITPLSSTVMVVPVEGPPGPQGPPGDGSAVVDAAIAAHVADTTPHPVYDDNIPDLSLIFENGLP